MYANMLTAACVWLGQRGCMMLPSCSVERRQARSGQTTLTHSWSLPSLGHRWPLSTSVPALEPEWGSLSLKNVSKVLLCSSSLTAGMCDQSAETPHGKEDYQKESPQPTGHPRVANGFKRIYAHPSEDDPNGRKSPHYQVQCTALHAPLLCEAVGSGLFSIFRCQRHLGRTGQLHISAIAVLGFRWSLT